MPIFKRRIFTRAKLFIDYCSWTWELFKNAKNAHACALRDCLDVSRPFLSDTSPKCIDGESLGRRRTRTRQMVTQYDSDLFFFRWNRHIFNVQKPLSLSCLIQLVWKKNYYRKRTSSWISRKIWNWRYYGLRGRNNQNLFHLGNFFCDTLIKMRQMWVFPIHGTESWLI